MAKMTSPSLWCIVLVLAVFGSVIEAPQASADGSAEGNEGVEGTSAMAQSPEAPPRRPDRRRGLESDPFLFVTSDHLLELLEQLTNIRPHLGWRHSTTAGEADAIAWAEQRLEQFAFLRSVGLSTERTGFRTFTGVEFWQTRVAFSSDGSSFEAPADGAPGHRDEVPLAVRFDSDGQFNDHRRDPVVVEGEPLVIRSADELYALTPGQVSGRIVLLDFAVVDRSLLGLGEAMTRAWVLMEKLPAAVVMVTTFSNRRNESHGSFAGDLSAYTWVNIEPQVPVLSLRLEDLESFGVNDWGDLEAMDSVRVTWDVDLFAPGESEYLMARIPGRDPSRAVILGAHIDSPNTPGAFDNGSGSAALVEVARALNSARIVPPVDLYLVWFGSHERGLYGSSNFTAHHSELLDRAVAMLQMDCLGHPLDGISNQIWLEGWSYGSYGDSSIPWPAYVQDLAAERAIDTELADLHYLVSDNSSFSGYDVPNMNMIFMNPFADVEVHYGNHLHDPYDDMPLARLEGPALEQMAQIMLAAGVYTGADAPDLRVTPHPDRRALFVGSHTEGVHMSPAGLTDFGMTLAWEGFDVDHLPYGRALTPEDLRDTDLVVALPVHDYPTPEVDTTLYDEAWTEAEIDAIEDFVMSGGTLVITNSAHRLKYLNLAFDDNEDWQDVNQLASRFGVGYRNQALPGTFVLPNGSHPLMEGVQRLYFIYNNALALDLGPAQPLASVASLHGAAIVEHGSGTVVVLADLGMLGASQDPPRNLRFWQNLVRFAR